MKTIIDDQLKVNRYYTVTDLARATGQDSFRLWKRIRVLKELPMPEVQIHIRRYYSEPVFRKLTKLLKAQ